MATPLLDVVRSELIVGGQKSGKSRRAQDFGLLNQRVAAACDRVTLMAAGLPLCLKGAP